MAAFLFPFLQLASRSPPLPFPTTTTPPMTTHTSHQSPTQHSNSLLHREARHGQPQLDDTSADPCIEDALCMRHAHLAISTLANSTTSKDTQSLASPTHNSRLSTDQVVHEQRTTALPVVVAAASLDHLTHHIATTPHHVAPTMAEGLRLPSVCTDSRQLYNAQRQLQEWRWENERNRRLVHHVP